MNDTVRQFDTGATRSADAMRYDPEGFLSPIAIERYCEYMNKHRRQPDGSIRDSDNWQKGIPLATYVKGMWRHLLHLWTRHRGFAVQDPLAAADAKEDLCAIIFNAQGMLFELLKAEHAPATTLEEQIGGDRSERPKPDNITLTVLEGTVHFDPFASRS